MHASGRPVSSHGGYQKQTRRPEAVSYKDYYQRKVKEPGARRRKGTAGEGVG